LPDGTGENWMHAGKALSGTIGAAPAPRSAPGTARALRIARLEAPNTEGRSIILSNDKLLRLREIFIRR
jgi:hypothetical protein